MTEHPTITALRLTAQDAKTLLETFDCANAWEAGVRLLGNVRAGDMAQAIHGAIVAVNAVPHLLAEVDRLRAQLADLRRAVLMAHSEERACPTWCDGLRCVCGAEDHNLTRAAARLALGLEENNG